MKNPGIYQKSPETSDPGLTNYHIQKNYLFLIHQNCNYTELDVYKNEDIY